MLKKRFKKKPKNWNRLMGNTYRKDDRVQHRQHQRGSGKKQHKDYDDEPITEYERSNSKMDERTPRGRKGRVIPTGY